MHTLPIAITINKNAKLLLIYLGSTMPISIYHFFVKLSGLRLATSNVATVIMIAANITMCAIAVTPKTHILPTQSENAIPHIQARSCIIKCLTLSSGICLSGLCFAFITEFHELYINSLTENSFL